MWLHLIYLPESYARKRCKSIYSRVYYSCVQDYHKMIACKIALLSRQVPWVCNGLHAVSLSARQTFF